MSVEQKISKKSWSRDEDAKLLHLIEEYGTTGCWTLIAGKIGDRTGKQCRERYHNHLKPDIRKDTWTEEEDKTLNAAQKAIGNQWAKIAKLLPGRSDNSVKNRWHIVNRKKNAEAQQSKASKVPLVPKLQLSLVMPKSSVYYDHFSHDLHVHEMTASSRTDSSRSIIFSARDRTAREHIPVLPKVEEISSGDENEDHWIEDLWNMNEMTLDTTDNENSSLFTCGNTPLAIATDAALAVPDCSSGLNRDDCFSEPALSSREELSDEDFEEVHMILSTPSVDEVTHDEYDQTMMTGDDDFLKEMEFLNDSIIDFDPKPQADRFKFLVKHQNHLREKAPRLTPRSPACPRVKRQRPCSLSSPGARSPFKLC